MLEFYNKGLSEAEIAATEMVVDLDATEITCPACQTSFATGPQYCPDCGLRLGFSTGRETE